MMKKNPFLTLVDTVITILLIIVIIVLMNNKKTTESPENESSGSIAIEIVHEVENSLATESVWELNADDVLFTANLTY